MKQRGVFDTQQPWTPRARSTQAVFRPSCEALIAATYPPGPPPTITTSYDSDDENARAACRDHARGPRASRVEIILYYKPVPHLLLPVLRRYDFGSRPPELRLRVTRARPPLNFPVS